MVSTARSVSVTRSAAWVVVSSWNWNGKWGLGWGERVERRERERGNTILLCARVEVGGGCGEHHFPSFLGDADQEILDLLEVDVCHLDVLTALLTIEILGGLVLRSCLPA